MSLFMEGWESCIEMMKCARGMGLTYEQAFECVLKAAERTRSQS